MMPTWIRHRPIDFPLVLCELFSMRESFEGDLFRVEDMSSCDCCES